MQFWVLKGEFSKSLLRLLIWILLIYESLIVSSWGTMKLECELSKCKTSRLLFQFFQLRKTNEVDCNIFVIRSSRVSLKYRTNISSRCLKTGVGNLQQYFGCNFGEHIWTKTKKKITYKKRPASGTWHLPSLTQGLPKQASITWKYWKLCI